MLDLLGETPSFPLAFAALLHDVGKPRTVGRTPDRYTFYCHEHVGSRMASEICLRLKTSNEERERVEWLVGKKRQRHRRRPADEDEQTQDAAGEARHPRIAGMHRADAVASGRSDEHVAYCERLLREWSEADLLNPPPLFTGHDLQRTDLERDRFTSDCSTRCARPGAGRHDQGAARSATCWWSGCWRCGKRAKRKSN